jgi:hypothetical protein
MLFRAVFLLLFSVAIFLAAGCAAARKPKVRPAAAPTATPSLVEVGSVMLVDAPGRFVLLDHGMLSPPPNGGVLKCFTEGTESAELVVTQVRRGSFTIADIRSGEPHKGDRVFFEPIAQGKSAAAERIGGAPMKLPGEGPVPAVPPAAASHPSPAAALDQ